MPEPTHLRGDRRGVDQTSPKIKEKADMLVAKFKQMMDSPDPDIQRDGGMMADEVINHLLNSPSELPPNLYNGYTRQDHHALANLLIERLGLTKENFL